MWLGECKEIDECEVNGGNPCNGGHCIDKLNEYVCNCTGTGFEGDHCQHDINECENNPCQNGLCQNTNGGYVCNCLDTFCGRDCQRQNPCMVSIRVDFNFAHINCHAFF